MKNLYYFALISFAFLTACGAPNALREETAARIAGPAWMIERQIPAAPFMLSTFERMHERGEPVNIYISGDGRAIRKDRVQTRNPTPENPVALHLASQDKANNVAYIARPCQFTGMLDTEIDCDSAYWTDKSFAPEVIDSFDTALDNIRTQYGVGDIHLIGHGGGAAIAAILAARRDDVLSLRTVAGNLDHTAQSVYFDLPEWLPSMDAIDFAKNLYDIPQHHFIGGQDHIIPPAILHSYLQAAGDSPCISHTLIQEAEHARGWVDKWPDLLKKTPTCTRNENSKIIDPHNTMPTKNTSTPIYAPRIESDEK